MVNTKCLPDEHFVSHMGNTCVYHMEHLHLPYGAFAFTIWSICVYHMEHVYPVFTKYYLSVYIYQGGTSIFVDWLLRPKLDGDLGLKNLVI